MLQRIFSEAWGCLKVGVSVFKKNEKMLIMKQFINLVVICTCMFDVGAQVSAAMKRNPHVNSESELYTRFLYEPVEGLGYERGIKEILARS